MPTVLSKGQQIPYTIRTNARAKRVSLLVHDDGTVTVTKPRRVSVRAVEIFVAQQGTWIAERLEEKRKQQEKLGTTSWPSYSDSRKAAKLFIEQEVERVNQNYDFPVTRVIIRDQRTRWGSCSSKGVLNFNYRLLHIPLPLSEYVVVHEICHLKEPNHSKRFWNLVGQMIPDYAEKRKQLQHYPLR